MSFEQQERITLIDALRGFTLLGILLVRTNNLWGNYPHPEPSSNAVIRFIDSGIHFFVDNFMTGKFYSIFTILFGLSFFIILSRAEAKNIDFRLRFMWRMVILLFIGCLHRLIITPWEDLALYGILGILLIPFYKLAPKKILIFAVCCLLFAPFYPSLYQGIKEKVQPPVAQTEMVIQVEDSHSSTDTYGTFLDRQKNLNIEKIRHSIRYGEFSVFGFFLLGLFLGKIRFFENTEQKKRLYQKILWISICMFCLLFALSKFCYGILGNFAAYFFSFAIVSGFILLYSTKVRVLLDYLIPYGKMGLTNYILQSAFGLLVFTPFFLNFNAQGLLIKEIVALLFYVSVVFLCTWHLKYFLYGPLEWFWRSATYLKKIPFRKKIK